MFKSIISLLSNRNYIDEFKVYFGAGIISSFTRTSGIVLCSCMASWMEWKVTCLREGVMLEMLSDSLRMCLIAVCSLVLGWIKGSSTHCIIDIVCPRVP